MNVKRLKEQAMIRWAALVAAVALLAAGAVPAATAEAQAPNAPGWVLAAVANNYSVVAHWGAVAGATGYDVNYSSDNGASWSSAATNVAGTSYTLYSPTISVSTSYVLAVRAKNSSGDSGWTHSPPTAPHHPDDKHALAPPTPEDPNDENPLAPPVSNTSSNGTSSNEQTPAEGSPQSACPVGYACAASLPAPTGVTVARGAWGSSTMTLSWNAVSGADGYEVQRMNDHGAGWAEAERAAGTSHTFSGLDGRLAYSARVRAVTSGTAGAWSAEVIGQTACPAGYACMASVLAQPGNVQATRGDWGAGTLTLTWDAVTDALAYEVQRMNDHGTGWLPPQQVGGTSYVFTGLEDRLGQAVRVRAIAGASVGAWADAFAPTNCPVGYACAIGSTDSGQQQQSGTTTGSAITAGAVAGRQSSPPAAPASVTLTRAGGTLTATWPAVPGADSYHVTYSTDNGASWSLAALTHGSASITIDASGGADYIVGVRARNASGYGGWTNSSPIMLGAPALLGPPAWTTGPGISAIVGPTGSGEKAGPPVSRYANTSGAASYCGSYADYLQPLCLQLFSAEPS